MKPRRYIATLTKNLRLGTTRTPQIAMRISRFFTVAEGGISNPQHALSHEHTRSPDLPRFLKNGTARPGLVPGLAPKWKSLENLNDDQRRTNAGIHFLV